MRARAAGAVVVALALAAGAIALLREPPAGPSRSPSPGPGPSPSPSATPSPEPSPEPTPTPSPRTPTTDAAPVTTSTAQGPRLRGRIVDEKGSPLAGAAVVLWIEAVDGPDTVEAGIERRGAVAFARTNGRVPRDLATGIADGEGRFELVVAPFDVDTHPWQWLAARHGSGAQTRAMLLAITVPRRDHDLGGVVVRRLPVFHARVAVGGRPIKDAWVRAQVDVDHSGGVPVPPEWTRTDGDGRATLPLAAWNGGWLAWSAGAAGAATVHGHARIDAGDLHAEVDLTPDGPVSGTVVDDGGRPVANASVEAHELPAVDAASGIGGERPALRLARRSGTAATDSSGRFELRGLRPGAPHAVHVLAPVEAAPARTSAMVRPPAVDVVFELPGTTGLSATVRAPPAGVTLTLVRVLDADGGLERDHVEGAEAAFGLMHPGTYRVAAEAPGRAIALSEPVEVEPGAGPIRIMLELRDRARAVEGRIVGSDGRPAAGAVAALRGYPWLQAKADVDGRFRLDGLPPGEVWLAVWRPLYERVFVRVAADATNVGEIIASDSAGFR